MIILGYPGIGKTTLSGQYARVFNSPIIDLESSCMRRGPDNERDELWYESYANIAIDLHLQGFFVLCSCHKPLRNYLKQKAGKVRGFRKKDLVLCYPERALADKWISRLQDRYTQTKSIKDKNALNFAKDHYVDSISELLNDHSINHLALYHMDYSLLGAFCFCKQKLERTYSIPRVFTDTTSGCYVTTRRSNKL